MKRSLKLKERLGALLLAALFAMQAILGLLPVDTVQAAVKSIEVWKTDQMLEYEYRFTVMRFLTMEEVREIQNLCVYQQIINREVPGSVTITLAKTGQEIL